MKLFNWIEERVASLKAGVPVRIANDGKPIDVLVIRHKDIYFYIDIDVESGEPTGGFGWSTDPTMSPTPIRDILIATPSKSGDPKKNGVVQGEKTDE